MRPRILIWSSNWKSGTRTKSTTVWDSNEEYTEFLGNKVTCHSIPIRPGRNLAIIVESAAVNHRQKKMGYNAAQELYRRVQESISRNKK